MQKRPGWRLGWVLSVILLAAGCDSGDGGSTNDKLFGTTDELENGLTKFYGGDPNVANSGVVPLTALDVQEIIERAVNALDDVDLHVAVVDRRGFILGVYSYTANAAAASGVAAASDEDNLAVSLGRTTAFFSNSKAPLSSRTVQFLSTFHFPPVFSAPFITSLCPERGVPNPIGRVDGSPSGVVCNDCTDTAIAPSQTTVDIAGTARGPLWEIEGTNRGALVAATVGAPSATRPFPFFTGTSPTADDGATAAVNEETFFNPGQEFPRSLNIDGSGPSGGIVRLPGAVPLFKPNAAGIARLVGGVGVFLRTPLTTDPAALPDILAAEYAALQGAGPFGATIQPEGAIFLGGILLPYVKQTTLPRGRTVGPTAAVPPPGGAGWIFDPIDGEVAPYSSSPDPTGPAGNTYIIGPRAGSDGGLTEADVIRIVTQSVDTADGTRAAIRLPFGLTARIIITIVDTRGLILAHYRMEDTLCDAIDVVPAKARTPVYFSLPPADPLGAAQNEPDFPLNLQDPRGDGRGIAFSTTGLSFLAQPFYPPGIDGKTPGAFFALAEANECPENVQRQGNAPPDPIIGSPVDPGDPLAARGGFGTQNGLIWFPGGVPLYKAGVLVGGLGISGDGVENNDFIAAGGARGFEPPRDLRCDNFRFRGIQLPWLKFPENPGPGNTRSNTP